MTPNRRDDTRRVMAAPRFGYAPIIPGHYGTHFQNWKCWIIGCLKADPLSSEVVAWLEKQKEGGAG